MLRVRRHLVPSVDEHAPEHLPKELLQFGWVGEVDAWAKVFQ